MRAPRPAAEALAYVGGVIVVATVILLVSRAWEGLGIVGRPTVVGVAGAALLLVGWQIGARKTAYTRRLASTLLAAAAVCIGGAVGITVRELTIEAQIPSGRAEWITACCAVAAITALAWLGYRRSPSAVGVLLIAGAGALLAVTLDGLVGSLLPTAQPLGAAGPLLCVLGLGWLLRAPALRTPQLARAIGVALLIIGVQVMRFQQWPDWLIPALLLLIGIGLLVWHSRVRAWPLLAGGVLACLLGAIDALLLYAAGVALIIGGLVIGLGLLTLGVLLLRDRPAEAARPPAAPPRSPSP